MNVEDFSDELMGVIDELRIAEEQVASLGDIDIDDARIDLHRVEHTILDSQAFTNSAIEALDQAFLLLELDCEN